MDAREWMVVLGAVATIAWVNWYFLAAGRRVPRAAAETPRAAGGEDAGLVITVDGGYSPGAVRVPAGRRVRLLFERRDESSCTEEVVIPDFGIRRYLPSGQRTAIEFTPLLPGRYAFTCGMGMLRGTIHVEGAAS